MRKISVYLLFFVISVVLTHMSHAQTQDLLPLADQKLHLIIVADTNDKSIGVSTAKDRDNITNLFLSHVPEKNLNIVKIQGNSVTASGILESIRGLNVRSSDTIVFYYSGHGAYDNSTGSRRHFFSLQNGKQRLYSMDVDKVARSKNPHWVVYLRDCCNAPARISSTVVEQLAFDVPESRPSTVSPLFNDMFFPVPVTEAGFATIGASQGELSYCNDSIGGFYTSNFCATLHRLSKMHYYSPPNQSGAWAIVHWEVREATSKLAQQKGKIQRPELTPLLAGNVIILDDMQSSDVDTEYSNKIYAKGGKLFMRNRLTRINTKFLGSFRCVKTVTKKQKINCGCTIPIY